ncbi:MAG: glycoside hydrolase family 2 TIM barrel-domain containing protein [Lentisphaeria bacterium]
MNNASTSIQSYPFFPQRKGVKLTGLWDFKFLQDIGFDELDITTLKYDDRMPVPSAFDAFPAYNGKRGLGIYRCFIDIPAGTKSLLKIGAAAMYCKVFVDGVQIGEHYSAYTPFACPIPVSEQSSRELVIMTCNRFDYKKYPLQEGFFDFYAYGGIFREVDLQILPAGELFDWVAVDTLDYRNRRFRVCIESSGRQNLAVTIDGSCQSKFQDVVFKNGVFTFELELPELKCWSPECPHLHTLTVDNGNDACTVRFGIRQVWTENGQIMLNGKPIKLLGFCRHEGHPQYGPALPYQQVLADLQLLRNMGCNFVRGSHYPQDPRFLDLCDEFGFLVFEESMGWGQKVRHFEDPDFVEAQRKQTVEMIRASYNHPCIIMRGFLNEGESAAEASRACYESLIQLIRSRDPFRLVTYASNRGMKDLFLEQIDVICFNIYPGWYVVDQDEENPLEEIEPKIDFYLAELKNRGLAEKPFIISEIGAGAIYGWRDSICAQWSEEYQNEYLKIVCRKVVEDSRISGVALWQFCDCRTYRSARALVRPRAFNNKGVLDEYRRPKLACESVKKIFRGFNPHEDQ